MPDNVLGPRAPGGSKPGVRAISVFAGMPDYSEEIFQPPPIPPEFRPDTVVTSYDAATKMLSGFNIGLGKEREWVFLPLQEVRRQLAIWGSGVDATVLERAPKVFLDKHRNAMIDTARKRLREGKLGTPDELDEYQGEEAWMTPEQVAVLKDLRAECG